MSKRVRAEYNDALRIAILRHGELVTTNPDIYVWRDYNTQTHLRVCVLTCIADPRSDTWNEFEGTFYEGDTRHYGVIVSGVSCECGILRNRSVRWETTASYMAEIVFSIAAEKWLLPE